MDKENYKPQHEVFFLATLALFPEKLTGQSLDPWFFRPYFNFVHDNNFESEENKDPHLTWARVVFDDYQEKGYIRYSKDKSLFKITEINTKKCTEELIQYLGKWAQNKLIALSTGKPPDAACQQALLLDAIVNASISNQEEPRVTVRDVFGDPNTYSYEPPFWELVLSCQLLENKAVIKGMDYGRRTDGLYNDDTQPYVDFELVDKDFADLVKQEAIASSNSTSGKPKYTEVSGLPCDFIFDDKKGIRHSNGVVVCASEWGNRHELTSFLIRHKKIIDVAGAKQDSGRPFTLNELRGEFSQISEAQRELKRISDALKSSSYADRIFLTLPKRVTADTPCQVECRQ